mmetsp:Transcript_30546/g.50578  ORF Transcript_30546/g.50578 Transcript_30546/m.50578 type:complete len:299 (+) Transcript_30546:221-1117(+)
MGDDASWALSQLGLTPTLVSQLRAERLNLTGIEPIRRHPGSRSVLQDVFVRLHGLLYDQDLLPLSTWGEGRGFGTSNIYKDNVARIATTEFVRDHSRLVPHGSACLEWDQLLYVKSIPGCEQKHAWIYRFDPDLLRFEEATEQHVHRSIVGDLTKPIKTKHQARLAGQLDVVICVQVFEHLPQPFRAAAALHTLLRPGGLVFFTAPFLQRYHRIPGDYWRYAPDGAAAAFEHAGFRVVRAQQVGDNRITTGVTMGFGVSDFPAEYLARHLRTNFTAGTKAREVQFINIAMVFVKVAKH